MNFNSIHLFIEVLECGSFAAVARQRNIDPSVVSRAIASLEGELGFRLFQRSTRKLAATEAGSLYFSRVKGLISEFELAGEQAQDLVHQPKGNLRVTACTSFGHRILAPHLPTFRKRYPDLTVELLLVDHQVDIIEEKVDLAIRFGSRPVGDYIASTLAIRQFRVCASPNYVKEHGRPKNPEDLTRLDCLLFPGFGNAWKFRRDGRVPFSVPVSGHLLITHGMTMTACTVTGLGVALLPDWLCNKEIKEGALIDLFPAYECTSTEFDTAAWLVYPSRSYIPLKLRVFIDFLKEEVTDYL